MGSEPEPSCLDDFYQRLLEEQGVQPVLATPEGVEAAIRITERGPLLFVLNHLVSEAQVALPGQKRHYDLLRDHEVNGILYMAGYDVAILEEVE